MTTTLTQSRPRTPSLNNPSLTPSTANPAGGSQQENGYRHSFTHSLFRNNLHTVTADWFSDLLWFRDFKLQDSVLSKTYKVLHGPLCKWLIRQTAADGRTVTAIQLASEFQKVQLPRGRIIRGVRGAVCST